MKLILTLTLFALALPAMAEKVKRTGDEITDAEMFRSEIHSLAAWYERDPDEALHMWGEHWLNGKFDAQQVDEIVQKLIAINAERLTAIDEMQWRVLCSDGVESDAEAVRRFKLRDKRIKMIDQSFYHSAMREFDNDVTQAIGAHLGKMKQSTTISESRSRYEGERDPGHWMGGIARSCNELSAKGVTS